jgi:DNA invertase Pin-like site-specific DNA recombinase
MRRISASTWAEIRTAYASGLGLREIARNMGIPAGTVLARSKREGWTQQIAQAKLIERPELARDLARSEAINAITPMQSAAITMRERAERHQRANGGRYRQGLAPLGINGARRNSRQRATDELADFVVAAAEHYHFDARNLVAVGYSNGANRSASRLGESHPAALICSLQAGRARFGSATPAP